MVAILGGLLVGLALGSILAYTGRGRKAVKSMEGWLLVAALLLPVGVSRLRAYVAERIHPNASRERMAEAEPLLGNPTATSTSQHFSQAGGVDHAVLDLD